MKISLRLFGLIGFVVFASVYGLTYSTPAFVEDIGKEFIKNKIIEKTQEKVDSISAQKKDSKLGRFVGKLIKSNEDSINVYKEKLKIKAHETLAAIVAEMADLDCDCRKKYAGKIEEGYKFKIFSLAQANEKLIGFMKNQYMQVSTKLKKDFRIFTGVNAIVFLFLILISFMKPQAIKHLFLPAVLMFLASIISSYFYLFQQNWFFTIIYDSYVGWAYLGYLSVVFAFLGDIAFNHARVTTGLLDATVGSVTDITFDIC